MPEVLIAPNLDPERRTYEPNRVYGSEEVNNLDNIFRETPKVKTHGNFPFG